MSTFFFSLENVSKLNCCYPFNTCIILHFLYTVLHVFFNVLTRRLYLTINHGLNIWLGGGGVVIRCWSLWGFEGSLQWSPIKIFLALTKFMQLDLLKCLSWFSCFSNLDEKVPEWSNTFIQWLSQWKVWVKFLKVHTDWRLICW